MNTKLIAFILLLGFLVISGCLDNMYEGAPDENESGVTVVYLDDFSFHPETVTIEKGNTVKWINNDTAASVISGGGFQSPTLRKGDSYSVTFESRGTYPYFLISRPWTRGGTVIVE